MGFGDLVSNVASTGAGSLLDKFLGGGAMQKAKLCVVKKDAKKTPIETLEFQFNPETLAISDYVAPGRSENIAAINQMKQGAGKLPRALKFKVHFDTYEQRKDVRDEYVKVLQDMAQIEPELHTQPSLIFSWGKFTSDTKHQFVCDLEEFDVTYVMFLPDGTPVRCAVDILLREVTDPNEIAQMQQSPDHAKLHTVRRGDTLQNIAYREYDDPGEWRRIAAANGIEDPLDLEPGTRLLVPPIL